MRHESEYLDWCGVHGGGCSGGAVLRSAGWGDRADRRPEWIQVMDGDTPIWPSGKLPEGDRRLNLDPLKGCLFGRLSGWSPR